MANEHAPVRPVALHAELDAEGRLLVTLPENVRQDPALMFWLHHRVVDLLADRGLLDFLAHDVEERLALLSPDITSDYVADLLREGEDAVTQEEQEDDETASRQEPEASHEGETEGHPNQSIVKPSFRRSAGLD